MSCIKWNNIYILIKPNNRKGKKIENADQEKVGSD